MSNQFAQEEKSGSHELPVSEEQVNWWLELFSVSDGKRTVAVIARQPTND